VYGAITPDLLTYLLTYLLRPAKMNKLVPFGNRYFTSVTSCTKIQLGIFRRRYRLNLHSNVKANIMIVSHCLSLAQKSKHDFSPRRQNSILMTKRALASTISFLCY